VLSDAPGLVICPDYSGPLWLKGFRQPLLVQLHGCATLNAAHQGKCISGLITHFERRTVQLANAIQACSRFTARHTGELLGFAARDCVAIPNPVDHTVFFPEPRSVRRNDILFVGKFNRLKGVLTLAESITEVFGEASEARLLMVGNDTFENGGSVQKTFLNRLPAEFRNRVQILGRQSRAEVAWRMRRAAVVVFPSRIEAFPLVLLEAMASGRPVVASRRGGIPEIVVDGINGLLADPEAPSTFARALLQLLTNPDAANGIGEAARKHIVEHYTPDQVYAKTEALHARLCCRGQEERPNGFSQHRRSAKELL
jgi:glycosyltransferase involved in cell wall biosynthesis